MSTIDDMLPMIRRKIQDDVELRGNDTIVLGFWSMTRRELPLVIKAASTENMFTLSDGGETWMDLVMDGICDMSPGRKITDDVRALASKFGVHLDERSMEIFVALPKDDIPMGMRMVIAASLSVEAAWRR